MKTRLAFLALLAIVASGCGEKPQVVSVEPGKSAAKPDQRPYDNDLFKGDRAAWERTLRARADNQNDYKRM